MNKEIHEIQAGILKNLLLCESARFSEIRPDKISSDQFTFHLKQLIEYDIVSKEQDGTYRLTTAGKEFANRFDIDSGKAKLEKQAKLAILVIASRTNNKQKEFLMQQRLKQPYFGFRGFITGKIKMGESVIETAQRELKEETGLNGEIKHRSVYHERIYDQNNQLLEDKYFFICTAENTEGELIAEFEGGKNSWISEADVLAGDIFYDISDLLQLAQFDAPVFSEKSYTVEKY